MRRSALLFAIVSEPISHGGVIRDRGGRKAGRNVGRKRLISHKGNFTVADGNEREARSVVPLAAKM